MDKLKKLTIEDSEEPIDMTGGYVFYGYNGYSKELQEVYLGRTLQMGDGYEDNEFAGRSNITKVTVGPHCKTVNKQLFMNCYNVNTIDLSNATSLLTIERQAFEDCDKVATLSIPASVQVIGYQAFYDMDELSTLTFEDSQTGLNLTEGQQFRMFRNENAKLKTVYLGRNVTISATASDRNFYNRGITDVTIGKYVTSIPDMLFYNNPFSTITFQQGEGPLSIGKQAFVGDGSTTLSSLVIPTPVKQIGEEAFYDNGNLQTLNITFYNSALIEKNAFDNCSKITTVIVDLADGMHARQAADCFESDVYENAVLKCNAYDATVATTYEPWKSFTHKDTDYNTAVLSFFYNAKEYVLTLGDDGTYRYQNDNGELLTFPLVDAIPVNAPVDFVAKVSYDRTVTLDGTWAETLFLPFSMEIPEGMTVYTLCKPETALDEDQVMFEEAERIEAMQPYIITLDGGSYTFGTVESTIKAGHSTVTVFDNRNYELVGTIDGLDVMSQYIATGTKMQFSGQGVPVSPYRAALKYTGTGPTSVTAVLKPVDFDIIDDATTNAGQVAAAAGRLVNVTLKGRTFLKNQNWNTLCVPFVHGCLLITQWDDQSVRTGFVDEQPFFYILTNTRAMTREVAERVTREAMEAVLRVNRDYGYRLIVVSRSDSCLRGHFPLETDVMRDSLLQHGCQVAPRTPFCPAFIEAGRITVDGIHYMVSGGRRIPVSDTEFARDNVFAYHTSVLTEYIEEKGAAPADYDVVNAQSYTDLRQYADELLDTLQRYDAIVIRSSSSLPKAISGIPDIPLLDRDILVGNDDGLRQPVFIVGSHVNKTTKQLECLLQAEGTCAVEVDVLRVLDDAPALMEETQDTILQVVEQGLTPVVYTSRQEIRLDDADQRQRLGQQISDFLVDIVRRLPFRPTYLVGKGGITSHDLLTKGLGVHSARVLGQIVNSVPCVMTTHFPYIIFPGNVGDEQSLREVYLKLKH